MQIDVSKQGASSAHAGPELKEVRNLNDEKIKSLLFKQVERPKGLVSVKCINVFDNRYRINLWAQYEEDGLTKTKIAASYFAVLDGDELRIIRKN